MERLYALEYVCSTNRKKINLRSGGGDFALQVLIGAFVLYVPPGREVLSGISVGVGYVISYANAGIRFLFGGLAGDEIDGFGFVFANKVRPVIVYFSAQKAGQQQAREIDFGIILVCDCLQ
ncbi:Na+ dependent nucleoside transporter N-terminal domain-containing protein, partial [Pseudoalteromonas spongiae]|uniref:Na+ dependent nucleoside transporter N-terminal domain-containing protein n=1 Tax=Pseudoalteromonas spongiae TaxID=298657 RepID=UPI001274A8D4